jgi:hypothetical protein
MTTHPKAEVNIMTKEFAGAKSVAISAATLSILTMTLMCFGASDGAGADGSKIDEYGPNPKGVLMFDSNGRYSVTIMRADLPKFAANKADQGSAVENQAVVAGLVTHFGTYSVNEAEKLLTSHIEASSFPNNNGVDQRRGIVSLTADELRYGLPVTVTGTKAEVLWKRAK